MRKFFLLNRVKKIAYTQNPYYFCIRKLVFHRLSFLDLNEKAGVSRLSFLSF